MYSPKDRYLWIREALSLNMVLEIPFAMRSSGMYLPGIVFLTVLFFSAYFGHTLLSEQEK